MPEIQNREVTVSGCNGKHLSFLAEQGWTDKTLDYILGCPGCFEALEHRLDRGEEVLHSAPEAHKALLMSLLEPAEAQYSLKAEEEEPTRSRLWRAMIPVVASIAAGFVGAAVYIQTLGHAPKEDLQVTLEAAGALEVKQVLSSPGRKVDPSAIPAGAKNVPVGSGEKLLLENAHDRRVRFLVGIQDANAQPNSTPEIWEFAASPGNSFQMKVTPGHKVVWVKQVENGDK